MTMKSWSTFVVKLSMSLNITTTGGDCQCLEEEVLFLLKVSESAFFEAVCYALVNRRQENKKILSHLWYYNALKWHDWLFATVVFIISI